jgi:enoyl-CoA hydratase/carnithine racemase
MDRLQIEKIGVSLVLTIDRVAAGNSLDLRTAEALSAAVSDAAADGDLRAIVITGAGERFFCSGGDLKAYQAIVSAEVLESTFGRVRKLLDQFESCPLPIIAAINGYALGGGMELALACDTRIATRSAKLGFPQSKLGLIPGWNGVERLVETVGRSRAMHLLLRGERLDASRAEEIGLIDFVVNGSAMQAGIEYASSLSENAPLSLDASKRAVLSALRLPPAESRPVTSALFERLWFSQDHREAERAFMEKRSPKFRGN